MKGQDEKEDIMEEVVNHFQKFIEFGKNICCVCHHDLDVHIDEKDVWRCHSLGADGYQCECALRKNRTDDNISDDNISYYDLAKRSKKQLEELEVEVKVK